MAQRALRTWAAACAAKVEPVATAAAWQAQLALLPNPHVLQSWEWGDIKAQTGWQAERLIVAGGRGAAQFLVRQPLPGCAAAHWLCSQGAAAELEQC